MNIIDIEFHDSECSSIVIGARGSVSINFSGLRVELQRDGDREIWEIPAVLLFEEVANLTLTRQLPSDGEVVITEIEPPLEDLKALLNGARVSAFTIVFSSGAELKGVAASALLQIGSGGRYIQTSQE